jgi:hypothetical protein
MNRLLRSIRPLRSLGWIASLALLAAACDAVPQRDSAGPGAAPNADVDVVVHGSRITPIFLSRSKSNPDPAVPHAPAAQGKQLRWELLDASGNVIDSGFAADPRVMRAEAAGAAEIEASQVDGKAGVLHLTMSGAGGTLRVSQPGAGGWVALGETAIAPLPPDGERSAALVDLSTDLIGDVQTLVDHGDPSTRARILVVPEGYTENEMDKFHEDAKRMADKLGSIGQYVDYWDGFNIYMQDIRSRDSGVADPKTGFNPTTAFEVTFGDDASAPRRCVLYDHSVEAPVLAAVEQLRQKIHADALVVLANADEYGGCASPANKLVVLTRNDASPDVLAHELGHSLFGLGDEYGGNSCNYTPSSPNLTSDLNAIPWKSMLTTSQLPTDPATSAADAVGAFDGAGYCDHGIYRPSHECMMRSLGHAFCPVCAAEMKAFFQQRGFVSGGGSGGDPGGGGSGGDPAATTVTIHNQTGTGLFARCPRQPGAGCSDWTWMAAGDTAQVDTSDPNLGVYIDNSTVGPVDVAFSWRLVYAGSKEISVYANANDPLSSP